jgi:multidrug efflux pump subunit AcrA (membrane-fusion protein)
VLVVNDKNIVEQRTVEVGDAVDGGMRVIKQGLAGEDRVVVSGIQRAIPGSAVKPVAAPTTSSAAANPAGRQEKP